MAHYYHVSPSADHPIGSVLQPGHYGAFVRQAEKGKPFPFSGDMLLQNLVWEAVLETARLLIDASLPSRLNCVYACTSIESSRSFRDRYRVGVPIFKIEAADDLPVFYGNLDLISKSEAGAYLDVWSRGAIRYWKDQPKGATEILIGGPVTILEKMS